MPNSPSNQRPSKLKQQNTLPPSDWHKCHFDNFLARVWGNCGLISCSWEIETGVPPAEDNLVIGVRNLNGHGHCPMIQDSKFSAHTQRETLVQGDIGENVPCCLICSREILEGPLMFVSGQRLRQLCPVPTMP